MSRTACRATSISVSLVIEEGPRTSPASTMWLVVARVSTPQRACGSAARKVSTIASEMRSQTLSGWPSDTDSLVKTKSCCGKRCSPLTLRQAPSSWRDAMAPVPPVGGTLSNAGGRASSGILPRDPFARAPQRRLAGRREGAGELEQAAAHRRVLDRVIGFDQFDRLALAQRVGFEALGRRLGEPAGDRRRAHRIDIVEKE